MTTGALEALRELAEFAESLQLKCLITAALEDLDSYREANKIAAPDRMRAFKLLGGTLTDRSFYARLCDRIEELETELKLRDYPPVN